MTRYMGLMPTNEIEKSITYQDHRNNRYAIDAGPNGWTIIYPLNTVEFKDNETTTEENFNEAYNILKDKISSITPIENE